MVLKAIQIDRWGIEPLQVDEVKFPWGMERVVALGESGRGRQCVYVHVHGDGPIFKVEKTRTGRPKLVAVQEPPQGWLVRINTHYTYTRGTLGWAAMLHPVQPRGLDKVIAVGWGAWGDAGRLGNWYDYLVALTPGTLVGIRWSGGLYKREPSFLWLPEDLNEEPLLMEPEELELWLDHRGDVTLPCENPRKLYKCSREGHIVPFHEIVTD